MIMAQNPTKIEATVRGDKVVLRTELMGRTNQDERPWDPTTVSDRQLAALTVEMSRQPEGSTRTVNCYDFTMQVPYTATMTTGAREVIEYRGESAPCTLVHIENSMMPGQKSRAWVDGEGRALRSTQPIVGGVEMVMELATREEALAEPSETVMPDVFARSVIECDLPIPYPRRVDEVLYRVVARDGAEPDLTVFDADRRQQVEQAEPGSVVLRVKRLEPAPGGRAAAAGDPGVRPVLRRALVDAAERRSDDRGARAGGGGRRAGMRGPWPRSSSTGCSSTSTRRAWTSGSPRPRRCARSGAAIAPSTRCCWRRCVAPPGSPLAS